MRVSSDDVSVFWSGDREQTDRGGGGGEEVLRRPSTGPQGVRSVLEDDTTTTITTTTITITITRTLTTITITELSFLFPDSSVYQEL